MRLSTASANPLLDLLAESLNGGSLVFYDGDRPDAPESALSLQQELVRVPLPSPAFARAIGRSAMGAELPETPVAVTGEARWAQLVTAAGRVVSDFPVVTTEERTAVTEDCVVIVDRRDFHRGGMCRVLPLVLTVPSQM